MRVNLKCFAALAQKYACDYKLSSTLDITEGSTVNMLLGESGIPNNDVKIVFVNGRVSGLNRALNDDDRVALVPATGGM